MKITGTKITAEELKDHADDFISHIAQELQESCNKRIKQIEEILVDEPSDISLEELYTVSKLIKESNPYNNNEDDKHGT